MENLKQVNETVLSRRRKRERREMKREKRQTKQSKLEFF